MFDHPWLLLITPVWGFVEIDDVEFAGFAFDDIDRAVVEMEAVKKRAGRLQQAWRQFVGGI